MVTYGAIEAGGTRWVCATVDDSGRVLERRIVPTTTPAETLAAAVDFFREREMPAAVGIGAFGPLDLRADSPTFGFVTTTPKPGWAYTDLLTPLREGLGVPVVIDTDVNAAAVGEREGGRGADLDDFIYLTVGTGIGGGAFVAGGLLRGMQHPEIGHMRIPHDRAADPFPGSCPYHGDCLEGLASGVAMRERWGCPAEDLDDPLAWELEASYLAHGLVNLAYTLAPQRIIVGGGVARRPGLHALVRTRVGMLLAGYVDHPGLADGLDDYVTSPGHGDLSGVLGAAALARVAATADPIADPGAVP